MILGIAILTSATTFVTTFVITSATTFVPNAIASLFTADDSYNVFYTISIFLVIVKPAFTKYLEETKVNLTKYVI